MSEVQTYQTHRRFDPAYHYVGTALVLMALFLAFSSRALWVWHGIVALALVLLWLKTRTYALKVQDRVIRLEETLRMQAVLPEALRPRISHLKPGQMVALRFAADQELADRVTEALAEDLGGEAIKKRIQVWRPDTFRV